MDAQSPSPKIIPIPNNFLLDHQNIPALNDLYLPFHQFLFQPTLSIITPNY